MASEMSAIERTTALKVEMWSDPYDMRVRFSICKKTVRKSTMHFKN